MSCNQTSLILAFQFSARTESVLCGRYPGLLPWTIVMCNWCPGICTESTRSIKVNQWVANMCLIDLQLVLGIWDIVLLILVLYESSSSLGHSVTTHQYQTTIIKCEWPFVYRPFPKAHTIATCTLQSSAVDSLITCVNNLYWSRGCSGDRGALSKTTAKLNTWMKPLAIPGP